MLDPPAARLDLARAGLVVDALLPLLDELEMLDRIGDVDRRARDAGFLQRGIELLARRADDRPPGDVFLVARLLADEHDRGVERPFAEHCLRRMLV